MKKLKYLSIFLLMVFLTSCNQDDETSGLGGDEASFAVGEYSAVQLEANVILYQTPGIGAGDIDIRGNGMSVENFDAYTQDGVLHITSTSNYTLNDSVEVHIGQSQINAILIGANHTAVVFLDNSITDAPDLSVSTSGSSSLWLFGLRRNSFYSELAGTSQLTISSSAGTVSDTLYFDADAQQIDENTLAANGILYMAESIETVMDSLGNENGYVINNPGTVRYFLTNNFEISSAGNTVVSGLNMPVNLATVNINGNALAEIWAIEEIAGSGQGSSVLNYKGDPAITYTTSGSSEINQLP